MAFDIMFRQLLPGMGASVSIFVLTLLFSLPLGLLVAFARMSKIKPLQWITKFYISIMRGTPLMLQLLVVYFPPNTGSMQRSSDSVSTMRRILQRFTAPVSSRSR